MKIVKNALSHFFKLKSSADSSDRFNIVLVKGNPKYLEDFTYKHEYLMELINEFIESKANINTIPVENVIYLALTFLIEVYKVVGNKFFRIIILTDQEMKPVKNEFLVENLLSITRDMPVFIDIVRMNVRSDKDKYGDKLEQIIKWSQGGELIHVWKLKELMDAMILLAEKKYNEADVFEEVKEFKISEEYSAFYEDLSSDLKLINASQDTKCMACFSPPDEEGLFECPACGNARMHKKCWAFWSNSASIGIRHIFRCPICFTLLKLPRDFVDSILGEIEKIEEEAIQNIEVADQDEILKEKDKEAPKLIEALLDQFV
ncbi:MAG: hypothetical protein ACTSRA_05670 [Promethearchaeota archaeon]